MKKITSEEIERSTYRTNRLVPLNKKEKANLDRIFSHMNNGHTTKESCLHILGYYNRDLGATIDDLHQI